MGFNSITIGITTYKRPNCLFELTKKLKELRPDVHIIVIDDCSKMPIDSTYIDHLINSNRNEGKKGYWKTVNRLWSYANRRRSDYYINLVDDLIPNDNFFDCIDIFDRIDDRNKIAMDLGNYGREYNWTNFKRVSFNDEVFLTQGTEHAFICKPQFIKYRIPYISPRRWSKNPLLGSGVGPAINMYWVGKKRTIFGVKSSMFTHNLECEESHMNPEERKRNPWIIL